MIDDSGKPILVKASIFCPECSMMRECKIGIKKSAAVDGIISCETCDRVWTVTFSRLDLSLHSSKYFTVSRRGSNIGDKTPSSTISQTKEPNPTTPKENR